MKRIICIVLILMLTVSCTSSENKGLILKNQEMEKEISSLTNELEGIKDVVNELNNKVDPLILSKDKYLEQSDITEIDKKLDKIESDIFMNMIDINIINSNETATVSVYESGYDVCSTKMGNLLIYVDSVEEYLEGYNIDLMIGNPGNITYSGLDLEITFLEDGDMYSEEFELISINDEILPGKWNKVSITLSDIRTSKLQFLQIKTIANIIRLF